MNRRTDFLASAIILFVTTLAQPGWARVHVDVNIGIPPPPGVIFEQEPRVVVVPRTHVYYVPDYSDYDVYRVGRYWYVNRDGYWYRSSGYRGPFTHVEYSRLPRAIVYVPSEYRR